MACRRQRHRLACLACPSALCWLSHNQDAHPLLPHSLPRSVTGRERPDVWFKNPASSLVLQVQADLRAIPTQVYAAVSLSHTRVRAW